MFKSKILYCCSSIQLSWYIVPGYIFQTVASLSLLCLLFPRSVTAQQIGSGLSGLGVGAVTLDWSTVASYLDSPLVTPFYAILNVSVGYFLIVYILIPTAYWGFNLYNAKNISPPFITFIQQPRAEG